VAGLFVLCMFLHGEMARLRPGPRYLTRFYLMLSLGGALGGVTVGLVAPHVLSAYYELGIGLVLVALVAAFVLRGRRALWVASVAVAGCCALVPVAAGARRHGRRAHLAAQFLRHAGHRRHRGDIPADRRAPAVPRLGQARRAVPRAGAPREPTSYYGAHLGHRPRDCRRARGAAPRRSDRAGHRHAGHLRPGRRCLPRLRDQSAGVCAGGRANSASCATAPRRSSGCWAMRGWRWKREPPQGFDVLAVDAFSGDSVPIHLITAEAMDVYLRHLRPGGIVAFHVTNRFLALAPVVAKIAESKGLHAVLVHDDTTDTVWLRDTDWVLVARDAKTLAREPVGAAASAIAPVAGMRPWTDDFNNLLGVLK
jgi:hypothetical protein